MSICDSNSEVPLYYIQNNTNALYRVDVLYDILECGVRAEEGEQRPLVEECVDKVRVAVKSVTQG